MLNTLPEIAEQFISATKEKRSAMVKKLTSGKDEDARRLLREEAIAILNGIEAVAYASMRRNDEVQTFIISPLLNDIAILRVHLYDRSAPVKMILEHLAIVTPNNLVY